MLELDTIYNVDCVVGLCQLDDACIDLVQNDETVILIERFNKAKTNYESNSDDSQVIKELSEAKKTLYNHPLYKSYSVNLIKYNKMISTIEEKINKTIYLDEVLNLSKSRCKKW